MNSWHILPATQCLFDKNKVTLNQISKMWEDGTVMIMEKPNGRVHYVAGSRGDYAKIGAQVKCFHDQTGASFGLWTVKNVVKYYKDADGTIHYNGELGVDLVSSAPVAVFK